MTPSRTSAIGGPKNCPAEPAAVAMPSVSERRSGEAARPTMARITPKPVPAMPKPIRIVEQLVPARRHREGRAASGRARRQSAPRTIAWRSPKRSAIAPKIGWPNAPGEVLDGDRQAELRRAASRTAAAIGIWKTPKVARMPKLTSRMRQPATRIGVRRRERTWLRTWTGNSAGRAKNGAAAAAASKQISCGRSSPPVMARGGMAARARVLTAPPRDATQGADREEPPMTDTLFRDDPYRAEARRW